MKSLYIVRSIVSPGPSCDGEEYFAETKTVITDDDDIRKVIYEFAGLDIPEDQELDEEDTELEDEEDFEEDDDNPYGTCEIKQDDANTWHTSEISGFDSCVDTYLEIKKIDIDDLYAKIGKMFEDFTKNPGDEDLLGQFARILSEGE